MPFKASVLDHRQADDDAHVVSLAGGLDRDRAARRIHHALHDQRASLAALAGPSLGEGIVPFQADDAVFVRRRFPVEPRRPLPARLIVFTICINAA